MQEEWITVQDVKQEVGKLKNNKSLGGMWLCAELIKGHKQDDIYHFITKLLNKAMVEGIP